MKMIRVPTHPSEVSALFEQARAEDLLVRAADGTEFVVTVVDEFDVEVVRTRQNKKLMALLDERAKQQHTVPLADVKQQLGLSD